MTWFKCGGSAKPTLITKNITMNGTYTASSDNADGYSQVSVNVPAMPTMIYSQSANRAWGSGFSYTFTESGTFQYYVVIKGGDHQPATTDLTIKLNDTVIIPQIYEYTTMWYIFFYDNITVSVGDVFTVTPTITRPNSGLQLFITQDANVNNFRVIGAVGNNFTTFVIDPTDKCLEVYMMGYYQGRNNYSYHFITGATRCVPTANVSDFYYGGTYAIAVL